MQDPTSEYNTGSGCVLCVRCTATGKVSECRCRETCIALERDFGVGLFRVLRGESPVSLTWSISVDMLPAQELQPLRHSGTGVRLCQTQSGVRVFRVIIITFRRCAVLDMQTNGWILVHVATSLS